MTINNAALVAASAVLALTIACSSQPPAVDTTPTVELIASLKQRSVPGLPDPLTPEQALELETLRTGPGGWFVQKGCFACHDVTAYGIKAGAPVGPDLSIAVHDVTARFGLSLEEFFQAPVGTMSVVLTQMIVLSPEEKAVAIEKLREANREHERQKSGGRDRDEDDDDKSHR